MRTALCALAVFSFSLTLVAADPFVGTWKLNVAKSKLLGSNNDVAISTMKISEAGPNVSRTIIDVVLKSGETRHQEGSRTQDGKEHPATGVGFKQEGFTEINQQVNETTRKITQKRDGKVTTEIISTVSPDGKVMTNHRTNNGGDEILIFEKQ